MRKIYSIFLALVMMFAFASTAMAAEAPTLTVVVNGKTIADAVTVEVGQSVEAVVDSWAKANGYAIEWKEVASDIGDGTGMVLVSLDGKGSVPYNSEKLDEYEMYEPSVGDLVLDKANEVLEKAFPASKGLGLWIGNGTGFGKTGNYGIYVGQDWMFTVNGERPVDENDKTVQLYMNQAIIEAGDEIVLTYGMVYEPFAM